MVSVTGPGHLGLLCCRLTVRLVTPSDHPLNKTLAIHMMQDTAQVDRVKVVGVHTYIMDKTLTDIARVRMAVQMPSTVKLTIPLGYRIMAKMN